MFDFKKEALRNAEGAYERYRARIPWFTYDGRKPYGVVCHHLFWMLHNCVAHPLMGIFHKRRDLRAFHELTSHWLNCEGYIGDFMTRETPDGPGIHNSRASFAWRTPVIKDIYTWRMHNCVAHMLIGLAPCRWTFQYHDETAKKMNVEGWV